MLPRFRAAIIICILVMFQSAGAQTPSPQPATSQGTPSSTAPSQSPNVAPEVSEPTAPPPATAQPSPSPGVYGSKIPSSNQGAAAQNQQGTGNKPSILDPAKPPQDQAATGDRAGNGEGVGVTHDTNSPEALTAKFTLWLVIATAILSVGTFGLALSTRGLHVQTKRLADEAVEQGKKTERQIKIAAESAKASTDAAQAAVDALAQERPWVLFEDYRQEFISEITEVGVTIKDGFNLHAIITNYGRVPAINAEIFSGTMIGSKSNRPTFTPPENEERVHTLIAPGGKTESMANFISFEDFREVAERNKKCYVYVSIKYASALNENLRGHTEFFAELVAHSVEKHIGGEKRYRYDIVPVGAQNTAT